LDEAQEAAGNAQERPGDVVKWQQCLINAEDCLIKAERDPENREALLAEARHWNLRAREQEMIAGQ
jgi:hypothetical protein